MKLSPIVILFMLMVGFSQLTMAQCQLQGCGPAVCAGGCATGVVNIWHLNLSFTGAGWFDLSGTQFENTCGLPSRVGWGAPPCTAMDIPPMRFWAYQNYLAANSGCLPMYLALNDACVICSSYYDIGNWSAPPGAWLLFYATWGASNLPAPDKIDGCINTQTTPADYPDGLLRTVVEISWEDAATMGTTAHDASYLIAGVFANNTGNLIYDFEGIAGADGPQANNVRWTSVPDVSGITNTITGVPSCPGNYGIPSGHPLNGIDNLYFDVTVSVADAAPPYFTETGRNAGVPLIAGLQVVYAAGPEPTSSHPAAWKAARDIANPALNAAALIPHGAGPATITVALPAADCSSTGCFVATRIVYQDDSVNLGLPGPIPRDPRDVGVPWALGTPTGRHCGPVRTGVTLGVSFDHIDAVATNAGVEVRWRTSMEDDLLGFKVFRIDDPSQTNGVEVAPWIDARGPGCDYAVTDDAIGSSTVATYYVQEITPDGLGDRSPIVKVRSPKGGRDRR